ncbi:V-type ATP synthase subunit I [Peptoniphilus catoniae]|uniref:V-type ATP synthase subunit I n=1 Tax=Peptoniphilus catoniae TaxID=1660341 RepID=UPI0010FD8439|nr:V-type ATPase 116kDa subunit family protein [Peptoniphilus catoniae]
MAVEKMKAVDLIGDLSVMDQVIIDILKTGSMEFVDAQRQIDNNAFNFNLEDEENLQRTIELNYVEGFEKDKNKAENPEKAEEIMDFFGINKVDNRYLNNISNVDGFKDLFVKVQDLISQSKEVSQNLKMIKSLKENYLMFKDVNVDFEKLSNLEYFDVRFGILDKEARYKLRKNYENILAVIFHTGTIDKNEIYLAIFPKEVANEINTILRSLNWQDVNIKGKYKGTGQEIIEKISLEEKELEEKAKSIGEEKEELYKNKKSEIETMILKMLLSEKVDEAKEKMVKSKNYFYLSGFIAKRDEENLKEVLSKYKGLGINFKDLKDARQSIPTKLKNGRLFKPFETLVKMYGVPSYNEIDPTPLFAISYMILFGSMFGDLGQGAVFFLGGLYLSKKTNPDFGGLLTRLGISSMIFGLLYGSVFGSEEIIPALFLRPFDNINKVLVIAVGFGVILVSISFVLGLINKFKNKEYEEAYFGKEGLAGFLIYLSMLILGLSAMANINIINKKIIAAVMIASLICLVFKGPLGKLVDENSKNREIDASYYIESAASLLEALMSLLSNLISFIRVGAFAINHVGLFMAFQTLGAMMTSKGANILVLIVGNLVIIGLEGLIVFIQSLRLEYYEMFSKFYTGDGYEFKPLKLN